MSTIERFMAKDDSAKDTRGLLLLFEDRLRLDPKTITRSLREYDPTMASATCELEEGTAAQGTPLGILGWGDHVVRFIGFDAPMPPDIVEVCLQPAHFGPELKAQGRAHKAHVLLGYAGREGDPLNQYVALAAVAGVLARHGALLVLNEAGHTAFPCAALAKSDDDMIALLESLPIPILYSGFVKYEVQGASGTWMRTHGNHLLGLPDFALLAQGHHEGQATMEMFSSLLSYLRSSGRSFEPGHTTQVGQHTFLRFRSAKEGEYFLESPGVMLVLEKISQKEINTSRA